MFIPTLGTIIRFVLQNNIKNLIIPYNTRLLIELAGWSISRLRKINKPPY